MNATTHRSVEFPEVLGVGGYQHHPHALLWLLRGRSPSSLFPQTKSTPVRSHSGKFSEGVLVFPGIQTASLPPQMKPKIWELLTPSPLSLSFWITQEGLPGDWRDLQFHPSFVDKVPCCMESGRSSILHVFCPCHDTPLSKSSLPGDDAKPKGVLFLNFHPLTQAYFGKHNLPRTATLPVNIAHHIDFATCPALPAGMNTTFCLPHSWSLLHTGHHTIYIVQLLIKESKQTQFLSPGICCLQHCGQGLSTLIMYLKCY